MEMTATNFTRVTQPNPSMQLPATRPSRSSCLVDLAYPLERRRWNTWNPLPFQLSGGTGKSKPQLCMSKPTEEGTRPPEATPRHLSITSLRHRVSNSSVSKK
eukprot:scaffold33698_cov153-Skeletonema_dohrnii-CCMP3373.AAC.7